MHHATPKPYKMAQAETEGGVGVFPPLETSMNRHDALFLVFLLVAAAAILVAAPMVVSMAVRSGADALGRMSIDQSR